MRTDNLPSASEVLSSDEVLGNFNGYTGRTSVSTLLNAFYITGTNEPDATTEGKLYIQINDTDNSIVNVYIKIDEDWVIFPKGGGSATYARQKLVDTSSSSVSTLSVSAELKEE